MRKIVLAIVILVSCLAMANNGSFLEMMGGSSVSGKKAVQNESNETLVVAEANLAVFNIYNDRASFNADAPDLPVEDFEGGVVGQGQLIGCGSPLTSASSPCFPGGIEDGLAVFASSNTNIVALGAGIVPINGTTWVGSDLFNDYTYLEFSNGDAYAVGLDIFDFFGNPSITINIYGANGLIGTSIALSGGFWGVIADEPITKLILGTPSNVVVLDNVAFGNPIIDTDGDGYPDDEDSCPESNLSATVVISGCDSGVRNLLLEDGCTISDLIAVCAANASNHGQFVSCVAHLTNDLKKDGLISGKEKAAIQRCAAQSK